MTWPKKIACDDNLKKKSQKFTILHYLTGKLTPYLTLSHLLRAIRPEAVGIKKRKSPQKRGKPGLLYTQTKVVALQELQAVLIDTLKWKMVFQTFL